MILPKKDDWGDPNLPPDHPDSLAFKAKKFFSRYIQHWKNQKFHERPDTRDIWIKSLSGRYPLKIALQALNEIYQSTERITHGPPIAKVREKCREIMRRQQVKKKETPPDDICTEGQALEIIRNMERAGKPTDLAMGYFNYYFHRKPLPEEIWGIVPTDPNRLEEAPF